MTTAASNTALHDKKKVFSSHDFVLGACSLRPQLTHEVFVFDSKCSCSASMAYLNLQLKAALQSLDGMPDVDVSRFEFLNGGSLWTMTFAAGSGDVASLYLNTSGLSGTSVLASVAEDVAGSTLGGSFRLFSGDGYNTRLSPDADEYLRTVNDTGQATTMRSEPLAWNAEEDDVRMAIEGLLPDFSHEGTVTAIGRAGTSLPTALSLLPREQLHGGLPFSVTAGT